MKKIALVMGLIIIAFNCYSQSYFNKIYPYLDCFQNRTANLIIVNNKINVFAEKVKFGSSFHTPTIIEIDSIGTIKNRIDPLIDTLNSYISHFTSIEIKLNESNYFTSGMAAFNSNLAYPFIIEYDTAFNILWKKVYNEVSPSYYVTNAARQLNDNGFMMIGYRDISPYSIQSYVLKTNRLGIKKWEKYYDYESGKSSSIYQMSYNSDSTSYLFSGITTPTENNDLSDGFIINTDTAGNIRWKQSYHKSWYDSQLLIRNDPSCDTVVIGLQTYALGNYNSAYPYYIGNGDTRILKIHANSGNILWEKTLNVSKEKIMPARLLVQQNGDVVVCGYFSNYNGSDSAWAAKISKTGDLVWIKAYNYTTNLNWAGIQHFADVKETNDGGYIFAGVASVSESNGHPSSWVVKTDSMGNAPGSVAITVGINEINSTNIEIKQLKVYPNPAKNFFSLEYDLSESEQALLLKITDAAGRTIEEKQLKNKRDIVAINCSQYAKGNYNCIIFEGQNLKQMTKIVIE